LCSHSHCGSWSFVYLFLRLSPDGLVGTIRASSTPLSTPLVCFSGCLRHHHCCDSAHANATKGPISISLQHLPHAELGRWHLARNRFSSCHYRGIHQLQAHHCLLSILACYLCHRLSSGSFDAMPFFARRRIPSSRSPGAPPLLQLLRVRSANSMVVSFGRLHGRLHSRFICGCRCLRRLGRHSR
jgi:hypothetical protein